MWWYDTWYTAVVTHCSATVICGITISVIRDNPLAYHTRAAASKHEQVVCVYDRDTVH